MKLPRDLSGLELARALGKVGYRVTRQTGSHLRLTIEAPTQHHVTIPTIRSSSERLLPSSARSPST